MKMTLLTVVLGAALTGCAGTQSQQVATNSGGRANEVRVYSLTGEQQAAQKVSADYRTERSSLPRP